MFGLAAKHGVDVDIHLHDGGELGLDETRRIAARTVAEGMQGRVAISHAFAVAAATGDALSAIADDVAEPRASGSSPVRWAPTRCCPPASSAVEG